MNYHLKSKPKNTHRQSIILIVAVFCVLGTAAYFLPHATRTVVYGASRPVWFLRDKVTSGFTGVKNFFTFKESLVAENTALHTEINKLALTQSDYDLLKTENEQLKNLLGRRTNDTRVLARVLSKPPQSPYDTLVIDLGLKDGIALGDKVYLAGDIIIGRVSDVTPHTSLITLFSSSNQKESLVLQRTGATFDISGTGGANLQVAVPKDTDVLWGDVFVYPALSQAVVGSVYYIDTTSQSAFKTVYIRIPGNVFQSSWVFVEKSLN